MTSTIVPLLNLPIWLPAVVVWIGIIGFPFVAVFAWVYERTPEGLMRESEVDRSFSAGRVTGRRLDYITIGFVAIASLEMVQGIYGVTRPEIDAQRNAALGQAGLE